MASSMTHPAMQSIYSSMQTYSMLPSQQGLTCASLPSSQPFLHPPLPPIPLLPSHMPAMASASTSSPLGSLPMPSDAAGMRFPPVDCSRGGLEILQPCPLARISLAELSAEDGPPSASYSRSVDALALSLGRYGAAILQLSSDEVALVRCCLASTRLYFRSRREDRGTVADWNKAGGYCYFQNKEMYFFRAGRVPNVDEVEQPPPGMAELFRVMGRASRLALCAIARHLRLFSDAFASLLDDCPLPEGEISSSVLTATVHQLPGQRAKVQGATSAVSDAGGEVEVEKGLLMLVAADTPGLQVCDPGGRWCAADQGVGPGDFILMGGRALTHATAGLIQPTTYRIVNPMMSSAFSNGSGRCSVVFRLMPRLSAVLDTSALAIAGHPIPDIYRHPIPVSAFIDTLRHEPEPSTGARASLHPTDVPTAPEAEPTLRSTLSDPLTGALLQDACVAPCGHTFGGSALRRLVESMVCSMCGMSIDISTLVPNLAVRAAAAAYKREMSSSAFGMGFQHKAAKRRRDGEGESMSAGATAAGPSGEPNVKRPSHKAHLGMVRMRSSSVDGESVRVKGVQFPFAVNEHVLIKGNKRTPPKFVNREAVITNQCLNGWYLVRTLDTDESVRLQYRSLQKLNGGAANFQRATQSSLLLSPSAPLPHPHHPPFSPPPLAIPKLPPHDEDEPAPLLLKAPPATSSPSSSPSRSQSSSPPPSSPHPPPAPPSSPSTFAFPSLTMPAAYSPSLSMRIASGNCMAADTMHARPLKAMKAEPMVDDSGMEDYSRPPHRYSHEEATTTSGGQPSRGGGSPVESQLSNDRGMRDLHRPSGKHPAGAQALRPPAAKQPATRPRSQFHPTKIVVIPPTAPRNEAHQRDPDSHQVPHARMHSFEAGGSDWERSQKRMGDFEPSGGASHDEDEDNSEDDSGSDEDGGRSGDNEKGEGNGMDGGGREAGGESGGEESERGRGEGVVGRVSGSPQRSGGGSVEGGGGRGSGVRAESGKGSAYFGEHGAMMAAHVPPKKRDISSLMHASNEAFALGKARTEQNLESNKQDTSDATPRKTSPPLRRSPTPSKEEEKGGSASTAEPQRSNAPGPQDSPLRSSASKSHSPQPMSTPSPPHKTASPPPNPPPHSLPPPAQQNSPDLSSQIRRSPHRPPSPLNPAYSPSDWHFSGADRSLLSPDRSFPSPDRSFFAGERGFGTPSERHPSHLSMTAEHIFGPPGEGRFSASPDRGFSVLGDRSAFVHGGGLGPGLSPDRGFMTAMAAGVGALGSREGLSAFLPSSPLRGSNDRMYYSGSMPIFVTESVPPLREVSGSNLGSLPPMTMTSLVESDLDAAAGRPSESINENNAFSESHYEEDLYQ